MLVLLGCTGTTKSGRQWLTQIGVELGKYTSVLERDDKIMKQLSDYREQLEYERSQLL